MERMGLSRERVVDELVRSLAERRQRALRRRAAALALARAILSQPEAEARAQAA